MAASLSICMVSDDFLPAATGVGTHLKLLTPELVRRGHRVCVITSRRPGEPEVAQWEGVTVFRVFTVKMYGFYQALPSKTTVRRILDLVKPDLVHHHYVGFMMGRVCRIAQSRQLPQVSTYHFSSEVLTQPLPMRPFAGVVRRLLVAYNNRFNMIIAPSLNLARQISQEGVHTPVRFITNPVQFDGSDVVAPAARPAAFTVLYAGRLGQEKNVAYLIKAFAALLKHLPQALLWVAGRGPEGSALEGLCRQLGISDQVRFLGFLDHPTLASYYTACDVFVLPSLVETQGLVAMEAMRFARPVIVTRAIVSADELVEQGVNGYVVNPDSVDDLTQRLLTLAADPKLRAAMGQASHARAEAYRPELVVEATERGYRDVLSKAAHG